jgi:aminoglycoside 6'-N-acetyltransferase
MGHWLAEPHVAAWWDAPETELAAIADALGNPGMQIMIAERAGGPLAYVQVYDPHRAPGHPYADQPPGTLGVDLAIGQPGDLGLGHGVRLLRQLARRLFADGARRLVIDPHPQNDRAIRAFEKAGFAFIGRRNSIYGPAHLMALDAPSEETDRI